ncbi:MAG: hypothetical protein PHE78_01595 [Candidatus Gastranaerophilales bacterium]|nr:hypothetical protein [Candidatus Gastranaerophilales bacterium]
MAFLTVQLNVQRITAQKADVEYWMAVISEKRTRITNQISELQSGEAAVGMDNPIIVNLQAVDKQLELEQSKYEAVQQSLSSQLESYEKLLQNNIKREMRFEFG